MMLNFKSVTIASMVLAMGISGMGIAIASPHDDDDDDDDRLALDEDLSRRPVGSTSGSGHTVVGNCGDDGAAWQGATGTVKFDQEQGSTRVKIKVKNAKPNTYFTVWLRVKGGGGFNNPAGSPWTGGGATPLCSGTDFPGLNADSPWNSGGTPFAGCNGFTTDEDGDGKLKSTVNFPVIGGAYPFQQAAGVSANGTGDLIPDVPTAIVDPRTGNGGPFLIRVISHCTDQTNHGLSPATREAWFQYP